MSKRPFARRWSRGGGCSPTASSTRRSPTRAGPAGLGIDAVRDLHASAARISCPTERWCCCSTRRSERARARDGDRQRPDRRAIGRLSRRGRRGVSDDRRAGARAGAAGRCLRDPRATVTARLLDAHRGPAAVIAGHDKAVDAVRERLAGGHAAPRVAAGRAQGRRQGAVSPAPRRRGCWPMRPGRKVDLPGLETPEEHPTARLVEARSHPDMRLLERLENAKTGALARNITRRPGARAGRTVRPDAEHVAVARGGHRCRRRSREIGRQRAAQDARGAAGELRLPARQPRARAIAADHPLALQNC